MIAGNNTLNTRATRAECLHWTQSHIEDGFQTIGRRRRDTQPSYNLLIVICISGVYYYLQHKIGLIASPGLDPSISYTIVMVLYALLQSIEVRTIRLPFKNIHCYHKCVSLCANNKTSRTFHATSFRYNLFKLPSMWKCCVLKQVLFIKLLSIAIHVFHSPL